MLVAAAQMTSGADKAANLETARRLVHQAADLGAKLIALPENFSWMGPERERPAAAEPLTGPTLTQMSTLAGERSVTLLAGSILETGAPGGRLYHLFDVDIGDGATYRESAAVAPGSETVVADTPVGRVGLSICYDLRFPELYRRLVSEGAVLLTVPAAFTLMTGKDHWEVLLRARAIENQCYVLAPAQSGQHSERRMTYGHSMLVDPWGLVVSCASDGEGLAVGTVDLELLRKVRRNLPSLSHRRL
jgi:predicted amidohydrolase